MILVKYNDKLAFHEITFKRMSDNVVRLIGSLERSNKGFKTYTEQGVQLGDFSDYTTYYKDASLTEVWYSNNGSTYSEPKEELVEPQPTAEEIKQMLIDGVQNWMDETAMERGYDSILSACSYIDTGVERFDNEGAEARRWRSQVWAYCYAYLDEVLVGERTIPTLEELIEELPKINW